MLLYIYIYYTLLYISYVYNDLSKRTLTQHLEQLKVGGANFLLVVMCKTSISVSISTASSSCRQTDRHGYSTLAVTPH